MDRQDKKWVLVFLILGAVGLSFYLRYYEQAIPTASLNFKFTRAEAYQKAEDFVKAMGFDPTEYRSAHVFGHAGLKQIFLERTLGLEKANALARDWVSIWYWHVRWFKSLEKEEVRLRLDPGGRVVGYEHHILESASGDSLAQDEALEIAQTFLTATLGFDLADYEQIEASTSERPHRLDHTFMYRKNGFEVGDGGQYRLRVVVTGDQVGGFAEFLHVPEAFSRSYAEIRSRARLLTNVAMIFWLILGVAMLVILMRKHREGVLRWRGGLIVGGVVAGVMVVNAFNGYPLWIFGYNTQVTAVAFIISVLAGSVIGAVFQGGFVALAGMTGGVVAQEAGVEKRNPLARFSFGNIRSVGFARATLVGYGLAFAHLGYLTAFYLFGNEYLGVWSPAGVRDYSNMYSTLLPWIQSLLVGLGASTLEEFFFRLLAIPLLIQWTGKRWLAVLIPAVVWAFLHANYPQEPIFIRGLELTVVGVIFGVVFLRYGIWAPVISHYVYNAFSGAFPMMQSDSLYFQISGILVIGIIFIPAIPAIWGMVTGRYKEVEEVEEEEPVVLIQAQPEPEDVIEQPAVISKRASDYEFSKQEMMMAAAIGLLGIALWVGFDNKGFGNSFKLEVDRDQAIEKNHAIREKLDLDVDGYKETTFFVSSLGSRAQTHLVRELGRGQAEKYISEELHPWRWKTRWFRPEEKEEMLIGVDHLGRLGDITHVLPEDQAGANLSLEEAQKIAEDFVVSYMNRPVTDVSIYKLIQSRSQKRDQRTDHWFVWERFDKKVGDGEFRVEASVLGDAIGWVRTRYKAPEEFLRKLNEQGIKNTILNILNVVLVIATITLAVIYLFRVYRNNELNWKMGVGAGILTFIWFSMKQINEFVVFYKGYSTSQALMTYWGFKGIGWLVGGLFVSGVVALMVALADVIYKKEMPEEMSFAGWLDVLRLKAGSATLWLQALFMVLCYRLFSSGLGELGGHLYASVLLPYSKLRSRTPHDLNVYLPFFEEVPQAIFVGVTILPVVLGAVLLWRRVFRSQTYLLVGLGIILFLQRVVDLAEDFYHGGFLTLLFVLQCAVVGFWLLRIVRYNLLVYVCMFWMGLVWSSKNYVTSEILFYQVNGILILVVGLLPLGMVFLASRKAT